MRFVDVDERERSDTAALSFYLSTEHTDPEHYERCSMCQTGQPGMSGYRPHTLMGDCWCSFARYAGVCQMVKQYGVTVDGLTDEAM